MSRHSFRRAKSPNPKRRRVPGEMNPLEKAYSEVLNCKLNGGIIAGWEFEGITLKLGHKVRYTPDFLVQNLDGTLELHETKACMNGGKFLTKDDSWVKLKIADTIWYHIFIFARVGQLSKKDGGGWKYEYLNYTPPRGPNVIA